MVGAVDRSFWAWQLAVFAPAYGSALKQALQLHDDVDGRGVTVKQLKVPVFYGVISNRMVYGFGSLMALGLLIECSLSWCS